MKLVTSIINNLFKINEKSIDNFIFYRIVDFISERNSFLIQCINSRAVFYATLSEIVYDSKILYGLHPTQACFIGIEYAKFLKNYSLPKKRGNYKKFMSLKFRYGEYNILYVDRKGNLCFIKKSTNEEFLKDPRDIALSKKLIEEFDASQAFHIGLVAGNKLRNSQLKERTIYCPIKHSYLSLVRN